MKLAWQPARGNVLQYRIVYKPAEGGDRKEIAVKGDSTQAVLKNLQPATEYELFVSARYSSGVGDPLIGTGTTLEGKAERRGSLMHGGNVFIAALMQRLNNVPVFSPSDMHFYSGGLFIAVYSSLCPSKVVRSAVSCQVLLRC